MQGSRCRPDFASASRVDLQRGQRHHLHLSPGKRRPRDGLVCDQPQDGLQPVVAGVVEMVGLGGGEQQPIDAAGEDAGEPGVGPRPEASEDRLHAALQVGERAGPRVDGGERIDEHDLPVEAGEVVAEERLHDVRLVALEAARQHGTQCAARVGGRRPRRQREKGEQGRAGEVARQQEAARSRRGELGVRRAGGLQVAREERGAGERNLLVGGGIDIERGEEREPVLGGSRALRRPRLFDRPARPVRERLLQQRQVDQPLAGIVDDIDMQASGPQRAPQRRGRRVLDGDAQLADAPGALRPLRRVLGEIGQVLLVSEARHAVVGLRLEVGAGDPPLGHGGKERQAAAGDEVAHQRGDEDGLARARQPRDPQAHGRRHQIEEDRACASQRVRRRAGEFREPHQDCLSAPYVGRRKGPRQGANGVRPTASVVAITSAACARGLTPSSTYSGWPSAVVAKQVSRPSPMSAHTLSASALLVSGPATRR